MRFIRSELEHIGLSITVLAVAISGLGYFPLASVARRLVAVALPLTLGFLAHELAHKYAAGRYGYFSIYRAWNFGLLMALLLGLASSGRFLFAAPGAVVILAPFLTRRQNGVIGLAGPLTNLAIAGVFYPLGEVERLHPLGEFERLLGLMGRMGFRINLWLAFFNLLPVPPLDGSKVLAWNPRVWAAAQAISFVFLLLAGVI